MAGKKPKCSPGNKPCGSTCKPQKSLCADQRARLLANAKKKGLKGKGAAEYTKSRSDRYAALVERKTGAAGGKAPEPAAKKAEPPKTAPAPQRGITPKAPPQKTKVEQLKQDIGNKLNTANAIAGTAIATGTAAVSRATNAAQQKAAGAEGARASFVDRVKGVAAAAKSRATADIAKVKGAATSAQGGLDSVSKKATDIRQAADKLGAGMSRISADRGKQNVADRVTSSAKRADRLAAIAATEKSRAAATKEKVANKAAVADKLASQRKADQAARFAASAKKDADRLSATKAKIAARKSA
jgi:hypothetical protein